MHCIIVNFTQTIKWLKNDLVCSFLWWSSSIIFFVVFFVVVVVLLLFVFFHFFYSFFFILLLLPRSKMYSFFFYSSQNILSSNGDYIICFDIYILRYIYKYYINIINVYIIYVLKHILVLCLCFTYPKHD